jgi:hypothetical protein
MLAAMLQCQHDIGQGEFSQSISFGIHQWPCSICNVFVSRFQSSVRQARHVLLLFGHWSN